MRTVDLADTKAHSRDTLFEILNCLEEKAHKEYESIQEWKHSISLTKSGFEEILSINYCPLLRKKNEDSAKEM